MWWDGETATRSGSTWSSWHHPLTVLSEGLALEVGPLWWAPFSFNSCTHRRETPASGSDERLPGYCRALQKKLLLLLLPVRVLVPLPLLLMVLME